MKTGILCHGRHVLAKNWELHEWGDMEKNLLGQIPKTLILANRERPDLVIFGTGASEKDGLKESEYTVKYMLDNFNRLKDFEQFEGIDLDRLKDYIVTHSIAEKRSQNTLQELEYAAQIFYDKGIERMIIVSNLDHISRCMQAAHKVYQQTKLRPLRDLLASQSDVGYDGTSNPTTAIIEMPHRGDDPSPDLARHIGGYFKLPLAKKYELAGILANFFGQNKI